MVTSKGMWGRLKAPDLILMDIRLQGAKHETENKYPLK
jgi:hypothetical protein